MEPLTKQPTGYGSENFPSQSGIGLLSHIEEMVVIQRMEVLEAFFGWEFPNQYRIENTNGQTILMAYEGDSSIMMRQCCAQHRGFTMHVFDVRNQEIMRVTREFKCCVGCCWCADSAGYEIKIEAPVGNVIGSVRQHTSCCGPYYKIYDEYFRHILSIRGPDCVYQDCICSSDVELNVLTADGAHAVGVLYKRWNGCTDEMLYRHRFGVKYSRIFTYMEMPPYTCERQQFIGNYENGAGKVPTTVTGDPRPFFTISAEGYGLHVF